jgi:protein O-GlcNAc transferase
MSDGLYLLEDALQLQHSGDFIGAEKVLRDLLRKEPNNADGFHLMGLCFHAQGRLEEALEWIERAVHSQPGEAVFLTNAGNVAFALNMIDKASRLLEEAVSADPLHADAYNNLALVRERQGRLGDADALLEKAIALNPAAALAFSNKGNVLRGLGRLDEAIDAYREAIRIAPQLAAARNGLGNALRLSERRDLAIVAFDAAIALAPDYAEAHFNRAMALAEQGKTEAADTALERALEIRVDKRFRVARAGLMPVIPQSTSEIELWRSRFGAQFTRLLEEGGAIAGGPMQAPAMNFYLAYHGENDRELIETLARFYRQSFPDLSWVAPHCRAPVVLRDRKIRLGVVSKYFGEHAVAWMLFGLLAGVPRDRFEVSAITYAGEERSLSTNIRKAVDNVVAVPQDLRRAREGIAEQAFDILLYADIGMEHVSYFLAFARLAPVQCVIWGHPDTTGIDTIDYYLSNDLAEPENGQESYSEQLVRLAGVQSWYPRMPKPERLPDREALGVPAANTFYLCPQNLIKIHPDMDAPLAAILRRDPAGRLVIFEARDPNWTRLLLSRWAPVFGEEIARVVVLPQRPLDAFVAVIATADVVLDTWPFGGGNTNYQTFAMGVPVVTLPGRWLRGRGTLAHYRHMGFDDCVAATSSEYVDIAVRLGTDKPYRDEISRRIDARSGTVLEDEVCIASFVNFLEGVAP